MVRTNHDNFWVVFILSLGITWKRKTSRSEREALTEMSKHAAVSLSFTSFLQEADNVPILTWGTLVQFYYCSSESMVITSTRHADSIHCYKHRLHIYSETGRLLSDIVLTICPEDRTSQFSTLPVLISIRNSLPTNKKREKRGTMSIDVLVAVARCKRSKMAAQLITHAEDSRRCVNVPRSYNDAICTFNPVNDFYHSIDR